MARDILSEYGPDSRQPQAPRASGGGAMTPKPTQNYKPPVGPKGPETPVPNTNHGNCGTQGKR